MTNWIKHYRQPLWFFACAALLLIFCLQTCAALGVESATVDETIHFTRGYLYLALGDLHFKIGHPILANTLNALPVWALTDLNVPLDDPSWETSWSVWSDRFVWASGNDVRLIFTLSRLVTVSLGVLTGCLVARWARELFGPAGGVVALALYVFEPNVIAHSHLVTDDMAVTAFMLAAIYGLWRFYKTRQRPFMILAGVTFGCAQAIKYTAAVLVPLFVLLTVVWSIHRRRRFWPSAVTLALVLFIAAVTVWGVYGFQVGALKETALPFSVPAPDYVDDLAWVVRYFDKGHGAYLLGETSTTGWWYYDLIAFAVKTPLPWLILLVMATVRAVRQRVWRLELLLPIVTFFGAAVYSRLDIGLRHLLPAYPFLFIYTARVAKPPAKPTARRAWLTVLSLAFAWLVVGTLAVAPHYLAYFNELVGGPANSPRYVVDSNLDWGQALPSLRRWMDEHNVESVHLSYFGTAHPRAYGIHFTPLPTWEATPEQGHPLRRTFVPSNPAPGTYAISATNLFGPTVPDRETLAWFRERDPVARVGHAIYVYIVEPTGPPAHVALSGLQIDELLPEAVAQLGTNDLRLRWFDARHSLVFSPHNTVWALVADDTPFDPLLMARFADELSATEQRAVGDGTRLYTAYRLAADAISCPAGAIGPAAWWSPATTFPPEGFERHPLAMPIDFGPIALLGYTLDVSHSGTGDELALLTCWRVAAPDRRDLKIFAHLLDTWGQLTAGQDRLDVPTAGWHTGDVFLQVHRLVLPASGAYQLEVGWYDGQTLERLPIYDGSETVADRLLLEAICAQARVADQIGRPFTFGHVILVGAKNTRPDDSQ